MYLRAVTRRIEMLLPKLVFLLAVCVWVYFGHAALQGTYGLLRRVEVNDTIKQLEIQLVELNGRVDVMRNQTERLSVDYLDLDLLDEQARKILGYIRVDEIVIN